MNLTAFMKRILRGQIKIVGSQNFIMLLCFPRYRNSAGAFGALQCVVGVVQFGCETRPRKKSQEKEN